MGNQKDIRDLMLPHLVAALPYEAIDPPEMLATQAGILEGQVVKLDGNENLYGASPKVATAMASFANYHIYSDPRQRRIREALARYAGTTPDKVVAGVGSDELIDLILRLFVAPGDRVIQCAPTFGMYATFTHLVGGVLVSSPRNEGFDVDVDDVRNAAKNGAKVLFIPSPNNPTGNLVSEDTVRQLLEFNLLVVVDEAYYEFSGKTVASLVPQYSNLVVLRSFSKWAGLAGLRIGYGIMNSTVADRLMVIKPPYNISITAEVAVMASLEDRELLLSRVNSIVHDRDHVFAKLQELNGVTPVPSHANFILCHLPTGKGNMVYQELAKQGIFVRYYDTPLLRDYIRVSIGLPQHNQTFLSELGKILLRIGENNG
ncbi:histidinol-phosphate transaminase [Dehalococcoidia bacterium]|nr:histidinol-phosphate transaminase [Dehalococcoidia bacterium]